MVNTGSGSNKIFGVVDQIILEDIKNQARGYFWLQEIVNVNQVLTNPLTVSDQTISCC